MEVLALSSPSHWHLVGGGSLGCGEGEGEEYDLTVGLLELIFRICRGIR